MLFSSATFLFAFLPAVALALLSDSNAVARAARNLLSDSGPVILFYAWGEPRFVVVMLAMVAVSSWRVGSAKIEASGQQVPRKGFLLVAVAV